MHSISVYITDNTTMLGINENNKVTSLKKKEMQHLDIANGHTTDAQHLIDFSICVSYTISRNPPRYHAIEYDRFYSHFIPWP